MSEISLHNSNCLDILKTIEDESISLCVTDPPYKITPRGSVGTTGGLLKSKLSMEGKIFNHNNISISEYAPELYRILKDGSHCYIMTNHINLIEMLTKMENVGFHFIKSIIWDKGNKIMGRFYMSQFEYILFFRKGKGIQINHCGTSDILSIPNKKLKDENGKNLHDTEKPVELMKILIDNSVRDKDDIVIDPFMGIGSTGVACKELDVNFIGIELDENYYKIAKERIEN